MLNILNKVNEPKDLKDLSLDELNQLAGEIRENVHTPRLNKKLIKQYNKATNKRLKTKK